MDVRGRLLRGATWITAGRIIYNLLGLVSTIVLARLLVPNDFGLVALGTTLLYIVGAITSIPLTEALVQHRNPSADHFHTAFTMTAARGLIISLIFAALAWPAALIYKDHRMINVMLVLAVGVALNGLGNPRAIMMTKDLIFWQQFMLQVAFRLTSVVVSVGIAIVDRSYWALLIGTLAGQLAGVVCSYTVLPFRPRLTLVHARDLMSFSVWLTFCQIVNTLNWAFDQLLIGTFLGRAALGAYVVADNVAVIPTRETTAPLTTTVFPAFSRLAEDRSRLTLAYNAAQALTTAVTLPMGVGVALIADPLVRLTMGEKWLPAVFIIQALASVYALQTLGIMARPLAMATGHTRLLFKRNMQVFLFRAPFVITGMYFYGLPGILYARVFTDTASIFFNTSVVTRITGLTFMQQMLPNVRALTSSFIMALAVAVLGTVLPPSFDASANLEKMLILISFGAFVYVGVTALQWVLAGRPRGPETEIMSIVGKVTKFPWKVRSITDRG